MTPLKYPQGADQRFTFTIYGFALQVGDTVQSEWRETVTGPVLAAVGRAGVTATVDAAANTIVISIPGQVSAAWGSIGLLVTLYTTVIVVRGQERPFAFPFAAAWDASYTREAM